MFLKILDHCLCSNKLRESIDDIYIVENEDDFSDHKPLVTVFKIILIENLVYGRMQFAIHVGT